jgi:hypothetical protein
MVVFPSRRYILQADSPISRVKFGRLTPMDKITIKILDHFQEVLIELNTKREPDESFLESLPENLRILFVRLLAENQRDDVPPTFLIVEQNEFSSYSTIKNGKCLGRWIVRLTSIEEFSGDPKAIKQERNGMYYSHGHGDFSIHDNGAVVRIGWYVGPLFGRGYKYSIVRHGDEIELANQEGLWIS